VTITRVSGFGNLARDRSQCRRSVCTPPAAYSVRLRRSPLVGVGEQLVEQKPDRNGQVGRNHRRLGLGHKYAYPEGREGEVQVRGAATGDGRYRLEVADAGRGLPAGFDLTKTSGSLGMRVITSLAKQLDGELIADMGPGARFTLTFPLKPG